MAVRLGGVKFLSSAYLQMLAACLLLSVTMPAVAWGPAAVDRAQQLPGPVERTAFVQYRHIVPAVPSAAPEVPSARAEEPSPGVLHVRIVVTPEAPPPVYQAFHSSLLANRAPPASL